MGQKVRLWKAALRNPTHSAGRWEPTIVREQKRNTKRASHCDCGCGESCNDGVVRTEIRYGDKRRHHSGSEA